MSYGKMLQECARLFAFTGPYWKMGLLALAFMFLNTLTTGAQLALIKPVLDRLSERKVQIAVTTQPKKTTPAQNTLGGLTAEAEKELLNKQVLDASESPLEELQEEIEKGLPGGSKIQELRAWIVGLTGSYKGIGLLAMALAPIIFLSSYFQNYLKHFIIWKVYVDISNRLCQSILPQSLSFFDERKSGELMSRVVNDLMFTQTGLLLLFGDVVLQPMRFFLGLGLAMYFSMKLFLLTLLALPFFLFPIVFFGKKIRRHGEAALERMARITEALREMLSGIRTVKAYKMEDEESKEFQEINKEFFRKRMKVTRAIILNESTNEGLYAVGLGLIVIIGGYVISTGDIGLGELGGFIAASTLTFRSTKLLSRSYSKLQECLAGAGRIFEILDQEPQVKDHPQAVELKGMERDIVFKQVNFAYNSIEVLKDIDLRVEKGQVVAIAGESGSGKSSLINLIPRFYEPTQGAIEIDGQDIRYVKRDSLLDQIAIVTQQTFLFNRSIAENIRYGKRDASLKEIEEAAKAAYIHDFIKELPKGYDTEVGELGVRLSGGQRQRITIARAFLKNAPILILDEATSALDSESEKGVQEALYNLMKGKTTFIIAHRLSTVKNCDKIIVLKDGRIVETGTHDELVKKGGEYLRLYQAQLEGEPA